MRPYAKPTTSEWYISSRHTAFNQQPVIYKSELVTGLEQLFYYTANTSHKDQKENIKKKKEKKKKSKNPTLCEMKPTQLVGKQERGPRHKAP